MMNSVSLTIILPIALTTVLVGLDSRVAFTPKYPPDPAEDDSWLEKAYYEYEATCQSTIPGMPYMF